MTGKMQWEVDPAHTTLQFKIKHLAITNVRGKFNIFQGSVLCADDDFNEAVVEASIDSGSIDTNNAQRDGHLRSPDLLATEQYPVIGFQGVLQKTGDRYALAGELQIREIRRPVTFAVEFAGIATGRFGDTRAGFELSGKINRKDFGVTWNILADGGGLVLGDEISLTFDIQLIRK